MTVALTATPVIPPATLAVPAPGEGVNSAGVQAYVQSLINSIEYCRRRTPGTALSTGLLSMRCDLGAAYNDGGSAWAPNPVGTRRSFQCPGIVAGSHLYIPIPDLWPGCVIAGFNVVFAGASGHAGVLPVTMPSYALVKHSDGLGSPPLSLPALVVVGSVTDASPSAAAFELTHGQGLILPTPEPYDVTYEYLLRVTNESGVGAVAGDIVFANCTIFVSGG